MRNLILFCLLLITASCTNRKFNKEDWNYRPDGMFYPKRESMLNDLLENHKLRGKNIKELREKFEYVFIESFDNTCFIYFNIVTEFSFLDPDPTYTKDLLLKLDKDSVVIGVKIGEGNH